MFDKEKNSVEWGAANEDKSRWWKEFGAVLKFEGRRPFSVPGNVRPFEHVVHLVYGVV
jgi:hypothetical protein